MIRILLAEKDHNIRSSIKQIIAEFPGIDITGEVSDSDALRDLLKIHIFDILLLDTGLKTKGGVKLISEITNQYPGLPVVALSMHRETQFLDTCFNEGASGYLIKSELSEELVDAVKIVLGGKKYTSANFIHK
jgi:two-component system, NarL family, invasion response regulator UvrY